MVVSSFQFPFLAFLFPFYYHFGLIRYHFVSVFTDIFVSVFVNGTCLNLFLCISISVNINYTALQWINIMFLVLYFVIILLICFT